VRCFDSVESAGFAKVPWLETPGVMTITLDITPELQAVLARRAAEYGRAFEDYVAALLEEAVH
jgi:hypothetical protein